MTYYIIVDSDSANWEIIDHSYNTPPTDDPVMYSRTRKIPVDDNAEQDGTVNVENAVTGAQSTGTVVKVV